MKALAPAKTDANLGVRIVAFLVDLAVLTAIALAALVWLGLPRDPALALERLKRAADGWTELAVLLYFATFESWGGTAGKRLLSLNVETAGGEPVEYFRALWRNMAKAVSLLLFPIAIAFALASERGRSIHDLLSGTVVRRLAPVRAVTGEPTRRRAGLLVAVAVALPLAATALVQRYGRMVYDSTAWREVAAARVEEPLEAFPELDGKVFFEEQHARCFEQSYVLSWTWNRFDKTAYARCLTEAYAHQMAQAFVLEEPSWAPHDDPRWASLEFTVRLNKGRLPDRIGTREDTQCDSGGTSSSSGQALRREFKEISPGAYRSRTLVGLREGPCRLHFSMLSGRWPLSPPLIVPLPTPDPVLVRAEEEKRQRQVEAQQRSWQCVLAAKDGLPPLAPAYTDEGADPLSDAVRRLRSSDVSERHNGAVALKKLGPAARSAIGELVRSLGDTNENSKDYVIQALVAADPSGQMVAPALRCLAEEPTAYVRIRAGAALAALNDPAGVGILGRELQSPDEHVRIAVVQQVRDFPARNKPIVSLLVARLRSDASARVRVECARTLPWIDPHSEEVTKALTAASSDPAAEVREEAASSLRALPSIRNRP